MNNKKLKLAYLWILVLVIACLAILSGCGENEGEGGEDSPSTSSTEVYIEKSLQPRVLYVEGQDLDLSNGAITIEKDGAKTRIPFNDSRVTVTGYDKNTIGNQTLTVTVEGKSTTLTVGVIPRMTVENAETEYFQHEFFNKTKGRVKIAKDDATTSYVDMKDSSITVEVFDSSSAGSTYATIKYTNGAASYECSFPVTIYTADKFEFKAPTKNEYFSHEDTLNLKGCYLQIKAASPSTFKKNVTVTSEMLSGYDPASVTVASKDEPVTQTITIAYAGYEGTFDVKVLYSPIYVIESLEGRLGSVDTYLEIPEGKEIGDITLPSGAGEAAKEAIERYFMLLDAGQQDIVDRDLMIKFARVAAFYVNKNGYAADLNELASAFTLSYDQYGRETRIYIGESEEAVANAIEILLNTNSSYHTNAKFLNRIGTEFGTEKFNEKYKISAIATSISGATIESMIDELQHILDVYAILKDVPTTWESELSNAEEFAANYGSAIINLVYSITSRKALLNQDYNAANHTNMYAVITRWRADFFDIVYSYYYYIKLNGQDQIYSELWGTVPAPGILEDFRVTFDSAYDIAYKITQEYKQSPGNTMGLDLYQFHYLYNKALDLSEQIKSGDNELYKTIYEKINLDLYINVYLNAPSQNLFGYYDFMGPLLYNENVTAVYDAYYALLNSFMDNGGSVETMKSVELFNQMIALSPTELHWFLSSLNFNYHMYGGAALMFDFENGNYAKHWISWQMYVVFLNELSADANAQKAFINLMKAIEVYSTAQYNDSSLTKFKEFMYEAINCANSISDSATRAKFNQLTDKAFSKYSAYYNILKTQDGKVDIPADIMAKFNQLYDILDEFNAIITNTTKMQNAAAYPALIALYTKAQGIYAEIAAAAREDNTGNIQKALDAHHFELEVADENEEPLRFTVDSYFYYIKSVLYGSLIANGHLDYVSEIGDTLISLLPLFYAELDDEVYEDIDSIIAIFRALDDTKLSIFYSVNASTAYFNAVLRYADEKVGSQTDINPGAAMDKINELLALYREFNEMYAIAMGGSLYTDHQRTMACTAMIAVYNKAKLVYNEILAMGQGDVDIMNAINYKLFAFTIEQTTVEGTLDDYVINMRLSVASILSSNEELVNAAKVEKVQLLLIKLYELLKAEATNTAYTGNDILTLLAELRALNPSEKYAFYVLQGNVALYAELERYLEASISASAKESGIISNLFNAEIYYSLYELDNGDEDSLNTFKEQMEKAIAAYASEAVNAGDKAILDDLYYNDLLVKYNALFPSA